MVVDIGCAEIGTERSIEDLIAAFKPDILYGFDPLIGGGIGCIEDTAVVLSPLAAWTYWGWCSFVKDTTRSRVVSGGELDAERVRCFRLIDWLTTLPPGEVIVKLDIEGGENVLVPHLINGDRPPDGLLVEWHGEPLEGYDTEPWPIP